MKPISTGSHIERRIFIVRGQRIMIDSDLAALYGVTTFNLNKSVKRNLDRFPVDFMFRLTQKEAAALRFQIGISKRTGRGGRRFLPYAFTEQGVAMLSSVLRSKRAAQVNVAIMRAFVNLRRLARAHDEWSSKLDRLERMVKKHDLDIRGIFEAMRELMVPPEEPRRKIGFEVSENGRVRYGARPRRRAHDHAI